MLTLALAWVHTYNVARQSGIGRRGSRRNSRGNKSVDAIVRMLCELLHSFDTHSLSAFAAKCLSISRFGYAGR